MQRSILREFLRPVINLGEFQVCRNGDNRAEVKYKEKCWEVIPDERKCSCRVWQVKGLPCMYATIFIAFTRKTKNLCFKIFSNVRKRSVGAYRAPIIKCPSRRPKK
ncbi:hypothetical protein OSB04_006077 [Centaurea solstitialis]|uniref:SWIM-type domain-containing protein n=1 Tax=Centaurea solstitialis TaxID=347529 RepID=A0AA38WH37_9ASTR|nr:hypothetical protein OSB04_006077 [Centaurea solstitialis]